jgi:hypothetical protein
MNSMTWAGLEVTAVARVWPITGVRDYPSVPASSGGAMTTSSVVARVSPT